MDCPYCREKAKDDAVVCPHCQRDLLFFSPIHRRLAQVESAVAELVSVKGDGATVMEDRPLWHWGKVAFAVLLVAVVGMSSMLLFGLTDPPVDRIFGIIPEISFFALGVYVGISFPGKHPVRYAALGLMTSLVYCGSLLAMLSVVGSTQDVLGPFSGFCVWESLKTVILISSGGLLGDWIEARRNPGLKSQGFAGSLAQGAARLERRIRHRPAADDRRERHWAEVLQGLSPVLSLVGVLGAAYLGGTKEQAKLERKVAAAVEPGSDHLAGAQE